MASIRDQSFFNVLFKAIEQFYRAPEQRFATVAWQGRTYFVYKKTALKIFRNLVPVFRSPTYKDDNALIRYLYERKNSDYNLIKLTRQSEENILTDEAHNELEKISQLEPSKHESAWEAWTEKHATPSSKETKPIPLTPQEKEEVKEELLKYQQVSGKEIKYVEKTHRPTPTITPKQTIQKLQTITSQSPKTQTPNWVKNIMSKSQIFAAKSVGVGGNFILSKSADLASGGTTILMGFNRINISPFPKISWKIWLFIPLAIILVLMAGLAVFQASTPSTQNAAFPPVSTSTNISSCQFTRAGSGVQFQSPLLLSFIQEASQKSSIPPVVLAAFIRVESPASSNMSDDQISNYSANCTESGTGALGIMQIQPPGTTSAAGDPASCDNCIDAGARLVGKTVSTMTREDYCDPRTNIIVGSGWILKKMSILGYGDGTKWDPLWTNNNEAITALVKTYYGCLNYGSSVECTGPYNYADDVSTSIQSCQIITTSQPTGCPAIGNISTPYGFNVPLYPDVANEGCGGLQKCHNGIDISALVGSSVKSTLGGIVSKVGSDPDLKGNFVEIYNQESGITITLEHLASRIVDQNTSISNGDLVGTVGATGKVTGPTLHYKISKGTALLNPFRFIGPSASISNKSKTLEDSIAANNYAEVDNPSDIWGTCTQLP